MFLLFLLENDSSGLALTGTTAALFTQTDQIAPLKVIVKYAKDNQLPTIKLGLLNHQVLTADQVDRLAKLPDIQVIRGQVVGMLASPLSRLVGTLNSSLVKLVIALDQIKQQKSN